MTSDPRYIAKVLNQAYPNTEWSIEDGDLLNIKIISGPEITMTPLEIESLAQTIINNEIIEEQAKITAKESAMAKLAALGLTEEEAKAVIGI